MSKINWNYIIKSIILILLSFILYSFVSTGYISNYVHERTIPYIKVSIVFMALISFVLIINSRNNLKIRVSNKELSIYLIPIILFSSIILFSGKNDTINRENVSNSTTDTNVLVVDEKNFNEFTEELQHNSKYIDGKNVKIIGFINNKKGSNEFYIARELMACCMADLSLLEIECYSLEDIDLDTNKWAEIIGSIQTVKNKKVILVDRIVEVDKPENEYIHLHK